MLVFHCFKIPFISLLMVVNEKADARNGIFFCDLIEITLK